MTAIYSAVIVVGTAAYALFLTCGESRLFAAGMAFAAAFVTVHTMLT